MLSRLLSLFLRSANAVQRSDPRTVVTNFIGDYYKWNERAFHLSEHPPKGVDYMLEARSAYEAMLRLYCPPCYKHQPIAFGSEAVHHPQAEEILEVIETDNTALVKTKHTRFVAKVDLSNDYEYRLSKIGGQWLLVSVVVVIEGERYEGL